MSKFTEIQMEGFKGNNCIQNLTGLDLFIGHNGAGKSARLQALEFAILGYIPSQSKTVGETFSKFSSADKMLVGLGTDNNFSFKRSISKKSVKKRNTGETEIKYVTDISLSPSLGEKNLNDKERRIRDEIGYFPIMVDFQNFLNMNDTEKRKFIYSITGVNNSVWNKKSIQLYLEKKLLTSKLKSNHSDLYDQMSLLISDIMKSYNDSIDIVIAINNLIDTAYNKLIYYKQEEKNTTGAVQKLADYENSSIDISIDYDKQLKCYRSQLIEIEKNLSAAAVRKNEVDLKNQKITNLQNEVNELISLVNSLSSKELENKISLLKSKIKSFDNEKYNELSNKIVTLKKDLSDKQDSLQKVINAGTEKKLIIESYSDTIRKIDKHKNICLIDSRVSCSKDFSKFSKFVEQEIAKNLKEKNTFSSKYKMIKQEIKKINDDINACESSKSGIIIEQRAINNENRSINRKIIDLSNKINSVNLNKQKLQLKKEQLLQAQNEFNELVHEPLPQTDILQKQSEGIKFQIKALEQKSQLAQKQRNEYITLKKLMLENKTATTNVSLLAQILNSLGAKGLQGDIMKEGLNPLKDLIQKNLSLIGINKEFSFVCKSEKGNEVFKIGWIDNNKFVDFNALSTGQKIMLLISFLTAVIQKVKPKFKILVIDNINELDSHNFNNVLHALETLGNRILDNIIIAGVEENLNVHSNHSNFKIWNLDEHLQQQGSNDEIDEEVI